MSLTYISSNFLIGNGNPEGVQGGALGCLYIQSDTAQIFCKKTSSANTSWQSLDGSVVQNSSPIAAATVNIGLQTDILNLTPSGTLTTLTVNLYNTSADLWIGKKVIVSSSQAITLLTLGAGAMTIRNLISTLALGASATYQYIAVNTWIRIA
jgi:hypothetical protein